MPERLVRVNFVLEEKAKAELEALAAGWDLSLGTVLREATHDYLRDPHRPSRDATQLPGRKPGASPALAWALHLLRQAGAQPSQISQARVSAVRRDDVGRAILDLPHVGRFKDQHIQLSPELLKAVATLVRWHREPADARDDTPLLVNGSGEPWPATKIARAMKRGKKLAATEEEPTNDQDDRSAGVDRE